MERGPFARANGKIYFLHYATFANHFQATCRAAYSTYTSFLRGCDMNLTGLSRPPRQPLIRPNLPTPCSWTPSSLLSPFSQRLFTSHFRKGFGKPQFLLLTWVGEMLVCLFQLLCAVCTELPMPMGCVGRKWRVPRWICRFIPSGHRLSPGSTNRGAAERG